MLHFIKKKLFVLCCILISINCSGYPNSNNFDLFLSNFADFDYPLNPTEFIVDREAKLQSKSILKKDYDDFLRESNDTFWRFKPFFEYSYGGKKKLNNYWILFYSRSFVPDDVNLQKSEIVLLIFTLNGTKVSSLPVAGGYGDNLTFLSIIDGSNDILVKYTQYNKESEEISTKHYFVNSMGEFIAKPDV